MRKLVQEIWEDIEEYEEYQVSNKGRVKRKARIQKMPINGKIVEFKERVLKSAKSKYRQGYYRETVSLSKDGKTKTFSVARLVGNAFVANKDNLPEIHHIDHNPLNNSYNNITWVSRIEQFDDHLRKLESLAKVGKPATNRQEVVYDGVTYGSYKELSTIIGCSQSAISLAKSRGQNTLKGKPIKFALL